MAGSKSSKVTTVARAGAIKSRSPRSLPQINREIVECRKCPRLVEWRERVACEKVKRFANEEYWGKPVPSFGDPNARLLIVGLAPAAHGGNRTGRIFTGDRSGDWLYRALYRAGFSNRAESINKGDGLRLRDCYITAVIHCAPPANKPLPGEIANCRRFLIREAEVMRNVKVVVALGRIAFEAAVTMFGPVASNRKTRKAKFSHGAEVDLPGGKVLIASFHPSQQNTFTGKLTESMFDSIFDRARRLIA